MGFQERRPSLALSSALASVLALPSTSRRPAGTRGGGLRKLATPAPQRDAACSLSSCIGGHRALDDLSHPLFCVISPMLFPHSRPALASLQAFASALLLAGSVLLTSHSSCLYAQRLNADTCPPQPLPAALAPSSGHCAEFGTAKMPITLHPLG